MRKWMLATVVTAAALTTAQAQPYGPGYMMGPGGYSPGYGTMNGYGPGYMMGPGYGAGMMYGYARGDRDYQRGPRYRGQRLCWKETDSGRNYGYYEPCQN